MKRCVPRLVASVALVAALGCGDDGTAPEPDIWQPGDSMRLVGTVTSASDGAPVTWVKVQLYRDLGNGIVPHCGYAYDPTSESWTNRGYCWTSTDSVGHYRIAYAEGACPTDTLAPAFLHVCRPRVLPQGGWDNCDEWLASPPIYVVNCDPAVQVNDFALTPAPE